MSLPLAGLPLAPFTTVLPGRLILLPVRLTNTSAAWAWVYRTLRLSRVALLEP